MLFLECNYSVIQRHTVHSCCLTQECTVGAMILLENVHILDHIKSTFNYKGCELLVLHDGSRDLVMTL